jgi:transcriptional regulator with XRE-family HTH domain
MESKKGGRTPKSKQQGKAFDSEAALMMYLKEAAQRRGLTHQDISDKTGIDRQQITRYLNAQKTPTIASFFKLADAVGVRLRVDTQGIDLFEFIFVPEGWVDETEWQEIDIEAE